MAEKVAHLFTREEMDVLVPKAKKLAEWLMVECKDPLEAVAIMEMVKAELGAKTFKVPNIPAS